MGSNIHQNGILRECLCLSAGRSDLHALNFVGDTNLPQHVPDYAAEGQAAIEEISQYRRTSGDQIGVRVGAKFEVADHCEVVPAATHLDQARSVGQAPRAQRARTMVAVVQHQSVAVANDVKDVRAVANAECDHRGRIALDVQALDLTRVEHLRP